MIPQDPSQSSPHPQPAAPAKPSADEVINNLRAAARRRRPWGMVTWLLVVLMVLPPAVPTAWWFWPRPAPLLLQVVAFDQVTSSNKSTIIRAAAIRPFAGEQSWLGREIIFSQRSPLSGHGHANVPGQIDEAGIAQCEWKLTLSEPVAELDACYLEQDFRPVWFHRDRIRVFTWPKDSRLLALDLDPALKNTKDWPDVAQALADAQKAGWHVVYLAANADTPLEYAKLRDWAAQRIAAREQGLVDGPVLAKPTLFKAEAEAVARTKILATLNSEFSGPVVYCAFDQGLQLHAITPSGELEEGPLPVIAWNELTSKLQK